MCFEVAPAPLVFLDHFDDGALDAAWTVSFTGADDWVYTEAGSSLSVTDIVPSEPASADCPSAQVTLTRSFAPIDDFATRFEFSWDSEGELLAMQVGYLSLFTTDNVRIHAGLNDAWGQQTGEHIILLGADSYQSGYGSLELSGRAQVLLSRIDGAVEVSIDGTPLLTGTITTPVDRVTLVFRFHNCFGGGETAFFGEQAVDVVQLLGTPAP